MRAEFDQKKLDEIKDTELGIPAVNIDVEDEPSLVSYLDKCWEDAFKAKVDHAEPQILTNMKQIDGEYDNSKLSAIREIGGSEVFMMITDAKCKNASNWVEELLFQPNQRPWDVTPTPIPELPDYAMEEIYKEAMSGVIESIKQEAQTTGMQVTPQMVLGRVQQVLPQIQSEMKDLVYEKARKLAEDITQEIDDKLTEGGWYSALKTCLPNVVLHTGFLCGPTPKKRPSIKIKPMPDGKLVAHIIDEVIPTWESRHPLNLYPSPDSTNINDGYLFDRFKLTPKALQELIGVPSYDEDEIREVLDEIGEGKLDNWLSVDQEKATIDDSPSPLSYDSKKIEALKFFGAVKGSDILEWGKIKGPDNEKLDKTLYYDICAYKIGSHVISIQYNKDPLGRKPYYKASFEEVDGSFWGKGLPQIIRDVQGVCNAMARAIVNNAGMACLTGDSIVYREHKHGKYTESGEVTINELWNKRKKLTHFKKIKLRSLNTDTGEFFSNKIVDIYDNGDRPVYELITERGYKIKTTDYHKFLKDDGTWGELKTFQIGDYVGVNGSDTHLPYACMDCGRATKGKGLRCKPCAAALAQSFPGQLPKICIECGGPTARRGVKCRKCASKLENSRWNQEQVEQSRTNVDASHTTARMRHDCQVNKKIYCDACGIDGQGRRLEIHHMDKNPWNNTIDNLKTLCVDCHKYIHARNDHFGDGKKHKYLDYDVIKSIMYIGVERVYNLQMEAPYHNYVSNGFLNRNSGPQVERNIDRVPPSERAENKLIPWKVWDVTNDMMAGSAPALKFYQPPMVVERLMNVYQAFSKIADEHSGVPAFTHGDPNVSGAGNALADYEEVITTLGPKPMGTIRVGDEISTSDNSWALVEGVFPQGESDIFRISFSNGETVDCDMNHRWSVRTHIDRNFRTLTTRDILSKGLFRKTIMGWRNPKGYRPIWMLPQVKSAYFIPRHVKIDPYTMGCLLGDGDHRGRLTNMDQEVFDRIPYELGKIDRASNGKAWTQTIKGVRVAYRSYGLKCKSLDKFIPDDYLYNSKEIRLEFLRGLMDTDGCCTKQGETFYSTSSMKMANDFRRLVLSLGANCNQPKEELGSDFEIKGRKCTRVSNYRVTFNLCGEQVFHLSRKLSRVIDRPKSHVYITGIEYVGKYSATCISVNSPDKLFLCNSYTLTHNTASGLSMLMGSAARGIKAIIKAIDEHIIKPSVERQYVWLIERKDYFGMVCDYQIVSGGTMAALAREQMAARRIEFMNSTANPVDAQIMGMEGRKYVLEETAKSVNLELSRMMPKNPPQPPAEKPKPPSESISFKDLPPEGQVQMAAHAGIQLSSAPPPTAIPQGPSGVPSGPSFGPTGASARTLDHAGNPVVGQDVRQFNAPGRAEGGPVVAGQPYTVGEYGPEYLAQIMGAGIVGQNGPEIIIPKADGMIIPQTKTSDYITVQDTTPRAIETNNLTIKKAPVDLIIKIATEAKKQGVDPNVALAVAWKETGLGTLSFPGHEPSLRIQNPMQFEATLRDKGTANAFEKKVQEAIKQDPGYKDIASMKIPTPEDWMFRRARLNFLESTQWQKALIEAGVSYLGDLYDKKGTLEAAFAKYRGTGKAAKYHGKHVMELYESIKSNPEIQNLIEGINIE